MSLVSKSARKRLWMSVFVIVLGLMVLAAPSQAKLPDLILTVGDTTGSSGEQNSVVTVFMDNISDTVSAIEFWLRLDRTDILEFQTNIDTIIDITYWHCIDGTFPDCLDSVAVPEDSTWEWSITDSTIALIGNIDTVGALISGWEFMRSQSVTGDPYDIKVTAQANLLAVPGNTPGIAPQQGGVLFRLRGDIFVISDTLTDRTVGIRPDVFLEHYNFSRPDGTSIGIRTEFVPDTNCFHCITWAPPPNDTICLDFEQIPCTDTDNIDWIEVGVDTVAVFDSAKVWLNNGSLTVLLGACGNYNCDLENDVNITDLVALINSLFITFEPLCSSLASSNINCDPQGNVDVLDLVALINRLFITFEPLCCE